MSTRRESSRRLLPRRQVAADAALGGPDHPSAGRYSPARLVGRAGGRRFPLAPPSWPGTVPRPAAERHLGAGYDTEWARRYPVRLARAMLIDNVTRPLARVVASPLLRGTEYLDGLEAPVIFAANHASHIDTPLLLSCLPLRFRHRTVVAGAADYFFDRRWKADLFAFSINAIPIERNKVDRRSARLAAELLGDGWSLVIFPEGGRSPDGWAQEFTGGAAYLAEKTGRPVVPVHLDGTRRILPKGGTGINRARTTVTFGPPIRPDEGERARKMGVRIEQAIAALADESTTDWWTARKRAASGTTPRLQGPDVPAWRRAWALPGPDSTEPVGADRAWPRNAS